MPISGCKMEKCRIMAINGHKKEPSGSPEGSFCRSHPCLLAAEIVQTHIADVFPLVGDDVLGISAKNTGGLVFIEDDRGAVYIDFKGVALRNVQRAAELDG